MQVSSLVTNDMQVSSIMNVDKWYNEQTKYLDLSIVIFIYLRRIF
jgi:hypothetical protein